jgi:hypothetical protein
MGRRSWTTPEVDALKNVLELLQPHRIDYEQAALLFEDRTASEIQSKCVALRDLERRRARRRLLAEACRARRRGQASLTTVTEPTWGVKLHPAVVWVPTTHNDIEPLLL